jgi:hypothetical protein
MRPVRTQGAHQRDGHMQCDHCDETIEEAETGEHRKTCPGLTGLILDIVHTETGWGQPLRPNCEFEELTIERVQQGSPGTLDIEFQYHFDEDGFSQYDKTHQLQGLVRTTGKDTVDLLKLEETHTGVAANLRYASKPAG